MGPYVLCFAAGSLGSDPVLQSAASALADGIESIKALAAAYVEQLHDYAGLSANTGGGFNEAASHDAFFQQASLEVRLHVLLVCARCRSVPSPARAVSSPPPAVSPTPVRRLALRILKWSYSGMASWRVK